VMSDVDENGRLQTALGELTPLRRKGLFSTRRVVNVPRFGQMGIRQGFEEFFVSIPDKPDSVKCCKYLINHLAI
jgi:hypothetical protein